MKADEQPTVESFAPSLYRKLTPFERALARRYFPNIAMQPNSRNRTPEAIAKLAYLYAGAIWIVFAGPIAVFGEAVHGSTLAGGASTAISIALFAVSVWLFALALFRFMQVRRLFSVSEP
jgi:hypothetical protein